MCQATQGVIHTCGGSCRLTRVVVVGVCVYSVSIESVCPVSECPVMYLFEMCVVFWQGV